MNRRKFLGAVIVAAAAAIGIKPKAAEAQTFDEQMANLREKMAKQKLERGRKLMAFLEKNGRVEMTPWERTWIVPYREATGVSLLPKSPAQFT